MSMKDKAKTAQLQTVNKVTRHESRSRADSLCQLLQRRTQEEHKLVALIGFRKDYQDAQQQQQSTEAPISIQQAQNYRRFIGELSLAIAQQQQKLHKISLEIEQSIHIWNASRQKNRAIENLIVQYQQQARRASERLEDRVASDYGRYHMRTAVS